MSIKEIESVVKCTHIFFSPKDNKGHLFRFKPVGLDDKINLSENPFDIISVDTIFLETDIAQGTIFKGKRLGKIHKFTVDSDTGYIYIRRFRGGLQWFSKESKNSVSNNSFEIKSETGKIISFNSQSKTFPFLFLKY